MITDYFSHKENNAKSVVSISVIVPIYNVEPYLKDCLDSLERQSFKDFEVIMINDGSTDNSAKIAAEYTKRNINFKLVNRKNGGLSAARNTGIEHATGKYIFFLDSDDYIKDNALIILYKKSEAENLDIIHFVSDKLVNSENVHVWKIESGPRYNGSYPNTYSGIEMLNLFAIYNDEAHPSCCMVFIRRDLIIHNNLKFYEGIIHEDTLFHMQLVYVAKRVAVLNEPLYLQRERSGSITRSFDYKKYMYSMCILAQSANHFGEPNYNLIKPYFDWYMKYFLCNMIKCWHKLDRKQRNNSELKKYYSIVKPIAKKYKYFNDRRLFLFTKSRTIYYIANNIYEIIKKGS